MVLSVGLFYYVMVFVALMGFSVGSFLNVVIYRVPAGLSVASPASRCGVCKHPIRFYDNIPVLSWFLLRGKCRDCKAPISPRYMFIELLTGLIAVFIWWQLPLLVSHVGLSPDHVTLTTFGVLFLYRFTLAALLIVISFIDLDHFIIPHRFTIAGMLIGLSSPWVMQWILGNPGYLTFWPPVMPIMSLIGLLFGGLFIIGIFYLYLWIRGIAGLGGGDATLMAMVGAWLGVPGIIFVCFAASIQGILAAGVTSLLGVKFVTDSRTLLSDDDTEPTESKEETTDIEQEEATLEEAEDKEGMKYAAIPFGPFIALSALEFLLFGAWFPHYINLLPTYYLFL